MARTRHFYCGAPCSILDCGSKIPKAKRYIHTHTQRRERFYYKNKIVNIVHFFLKEEDSKDMHVTNTVFFYKSGRTFYS